MASPANIGHLVPRELHWGIWHPLQTLAIWCHSELHRGIWLPLQTLSIWCPSELHRGIWDPVQTLGIWCPMNVTREYSIPCNTKYLMVQLKCTNGILSLSRSSHRTQHIIILSGVAVSWVAMYLDIACIGFQINSCHL